MVDNAKKTKQTKKNITHNITQNIKQTPNKPKKQQKTYRREIINITKTFYNLGLQGQPNFNQILISSARFHPGPKINPGVVPGCKNARQRRPKGAKMLPKGSQKAWKKHPKGVHKASKLDPTGIKITQTQCRELQRNIRASHLNKNRNTCKSDLSSHLDCSHLSQCCFLTCKPLACPGVQVQFTKSN